MGRWSAQLLELHLGDQWQLGEQSDQHRHFDNDTSSSKGCRGTGTIELPKDTLALLLAVLLLMSGCPG